MENTKELSIQRMWLRILAIVVFALSLAIVFLYKDAQRTRIELQHMQALQQDNVLLAPQPAETSQSTLTTTSAPKPIVPDESGMNSQSRVYYELSCGKVVSWSFAKESLKNEPTTMELMMINNQTHLNGKIIEHIYHNAVVFAQVRAIEVQEAPYADADTQTVRDLLVGKSVSISRAARVFIGDRFHPVSDKAYDAFEKLNVSFNDYHLFQSRLAIIYRPPPPTP